MNGYNVKCNNSKCGYHGEEDNCDRAKDKILDDFDILTVGEAGTCANMIPRAEGK